MKKITGGIRQIPREYRREALFLLFLLVYFTAWAYIQPLGVSPDESMRYDVAKYIYNHGALPRGDDPELLNPVWGLSYAFYPFFSYMIAACSMKVMSVFSTDPYDLVVAARMVSVLFGVGSIFFVIRIAKRLFDEKTGKLFVMLMAFLPNTAFLSSYVNIDAMAMFCTAFILYVWARLFTEDWTIKNCVLLGISVGLCALSYYNAYGIVLCTILLFIITMLAGQRHRLDFKKLMTRGLLISAVTLAVCGWWFARNFILYDGDILGRQALNACAEEHALEEYKPSRHPTPQREGQSVPEMIFKRRDDQEFSWIRMMLMSFIGVYGCLSVREPVWYYQIWWALLLVGLLGIFFTPRKLFAVRENGAWRDVGWIHWAMVLAIIIPNVLNVYYSYVVDYQAQGRYSFPMAIPLLYFVATGYRNIAEGLIRRRHRQRTLLLGLGCAAMVLGIYSYVTLFLPVYLPDIQLILAQR